MPSKRKIIEFHALLRELQLTENKADMLASFGVMSTKKLSEAEMDTLLERLRAQKPAPKEPSPALRRARSQVLKLLNEMDIYGWPRINAYLEDARIFGKRLNQTTDVDETKALVRKLRKMKRDRDKAVQAENYIATNS